MVYSLSRAAMRVLSSAGTAGSGREGFIVWGVKVVSGKAWSKREPVLRRASYFDMMAS